MYLGVQVNLQLKPQGSLRELAVQRPPIYFTDQSDNPRGAGGFTALIDLLCHLDVGSDPVY